MARKKITLLKLCLNHLLFQWAATPGPLLPPALPADSSSFTCMDSPSPGLVSGALPNGAHKSLPNPCPFNPGGVSGAGCRHRFAFGQPSAPPPSTADALKRHLRASRSFHQLHVAEGEADRSAAHPSCAPVPKCGPRSRSSELPSARAATERAAIAGKP